MLGQTLDVAPLADCSLSQYFPTSTAYCGSQGGNSYDFLGNPQTGDSLETLMNFPSDPGGVPADSTVVGATLNLDVATVSGAPADFYILPMTREFVPSEGSWDYYDTATASPWTTPGGDYAESIAGGGSITATGAQSFDLTSLVSQWVDGSSPWPTSLMLYPLGTGSSATFYNVEKGGANAPYLAIDYVPRVGDQPGATIDTTRLDNQMSYGVNVANGNLLLNSTDLSVSGTGLDATVQRDYNSLASWYGTVGLGWGAPSGATVTPDLAFYARDATTLYEPDGNPEVFDVVENSGVYSYVSPPGVNAEMCSIYTGCTPVNSAAVYQLTFDTTGERWDFNAAGQLIGDYDAAGNAITYTYNSGNDLSSMIDTQARTTSFAYTSGFLSSVTDGAGGRSTAYTQNSSGELTSYTDALGGASNTTHYAYDSAGQLSQVTDPDGEQTTFAYNASGQLTSVTRVTNNSTGAGDTTTYAYYRNGQTPPNGVSCGTDPSGVPAYGETVATTPDGNQTEYCYDTNDRVYQVIEPSGGRTTTAYDANDDVVSSTGPSGATTTTSYDCYRPITQTEPQNGSQGPAQTSLSYPDENGNQSCTATPGPDYLPSSVTQPSGSTVNYSYNALDELTQVKDGLSAENTLSFTYDGGSEMTDGLMASSTSADGNTTTYQYSATGNLTGVTPPAPMKPTTYGYDADSRLTSTTDGDGNTTTYSYDANDDLAGETYQGGATTANTYDGDGNLLKSVDSQSGTTTYAYDLKNRITSETDPGAGGQAATTTTYTYNGDDDLASMTDGGGTVAYAYNPEDLLSSVTQPGVSTPITFAYTIDDQLQCTVYPNGTLVQRSYDASGQLLSIEAANTNPQCASANSGASAPAAGSVFANYQYTYANTSDANTDLEQSETITNNGATNTWFYYYDALNRLIEATAGQGSTYNYSYDGDGNLLTRTANPTLGLVQTQAYNADDELCWIDAAQVSSPSCTSPPTGAFPASYDTAGNALTIPGTLLPTPTAADTTTLSYNTREQTTSINPNGLGAQTLSYQGDGQTKPAQIGNQPIGGKAPMLTENSTGISGQEAAVQPLGSPSDTYYTRTPDGTLLSERTPNADYYYISDANSSVVDLTNSTGAVANTYSYDPYGTTTNTTGTAPNSFGFDSGYDAQGGLILFGDRYYNPSTGTWTQPDPEADPTDPTDSDPYAFVGDDPTNDVDPTGELSARQVRGLLCIAAVLLSSDAKLCEGVTRGVVREDIQLVEKVADVAEKVLDFFDGDGAGKTFEARFDRLRKKAAEEHDSFLDELEDEIKKVAEGDDPVDF